MNTKSSMLKFKTRTKEAGQALVLIAMLVVILLAFLGLAIDGGGMFLLWRDAQNAVDTAALQAAFSYCTSNKDFQAAIDAGLTAAEANGFDNNMVDNWVTVVAAPERKPANLFIQDTNAVMLVTIRAVKPAYFIQLVYGGPLEVTVDTLGICSPAAESPYEGYAYYAMGGNGLCGFGNANSGSKAQISPNGATQNYYGSWFSNGNASSGGSSVTFHDGGVVDYVNDTAGLPASALGTNLDAELTYFPPLYNFEDFVPAGKTYVDNLGVSHTTTVDGKYWAEAYAKGGSSRVTYLASGGNLGAKKDTLNGLYVVIGDADPVGEIGPEGVTIVALGGVKSTGQLNARDNMWSPYIAGLTIFSMEHQGSPNCNVNSSSAAISFSGSGIIGFGVLYAPYGGISTSGADGVWCGAYIAQAIDRSGSDTWVIATKIPNPLPAGFPSAFAGYAGRDCDYINDPTPPYYGLGD